MNITMKEIDKIELEMEKVRRIYEKSIDTLQNLDTEKNKLLAYLVKDNYTLTDIYTPEIDPDIIKVYYKILHMEESGVIVEVLDISHNYLRYDTQNLTYGELYYLKLKRLSHIEKEKLKESWRRNLDKFSSFIDRF